MPIPHSKILDLLGADPVDAGNTRTDAENAENAVSRSGEPITAFRSFSASTRARESEPTGPVSAGPALTCYACRGTDFWAGTGKVVCRRCHPPAPGAEVLTLSRTDTDASDPVEMAAGLTASTPETRTASTPETRTASTPETRTHGVRGGAA
jgi:hypothetical protein